MPTPITSVDSLALSGSTFSETFLFDGGASVTKLLVFVVAVDEAAGPIVSVVFDASPTGILNLTFLKRVTLGAIAPVTLEVWYGFSATNLETLYPAGTMTVTPTGIPGGVQQVTWACFKGDIAATPLGTAVSGAVASDTTVSATVVSAVNELVVAVGAGEYWLPTSGAGQTDTLPGSAGPNLGPISTKAGAASVTCSEDVGGADAIGIVVVPIKYGADVTGPTIVHTPVGDGQTVGVAVAVTATITDDVGVASATLYYRITGGAFSSTAMVNTIGNTWTANIPAASVTLSGVDYYVSASDAVPNTSTDPVGAPASYHDFTVVDVTAPTIVHTAVAANQPGGQNVAVAATITDTESGVASGTLYYRDAGTTSFTSSAMTSSGSTYSGTIPGSVVTVRGVDYYLKATDNSGNIAYSPAGAPATYNTFSVTPAGVFEPGQGSHPHGGGGGPVGLSGLAQFFLGRSVVPRPQVPRPLQHRPHRSSDLRPGESSRVDWPAVGGSRLNRGR